MDIIVRPMKINGVSESQYDEAGRFIQRSCEEQAAFLRDHFLVKEEDLAPIRIVLWPLLNKGGLGYDKRGNCFVYVDATRYNVGDRSNNNERKLWEIKSEFSLCHELGHYFHGSVNPYYKKEDLSDSDLRFAEFIADLCAIFSADERGLLSKLKEKDVLIKRERTDLDFYESHRTPKGYIGNLIRGLSRSKLEDVSRDFPQVHEFLRKELGAV